MDAVELIKHERWQDALCALHIVATSDEVSQQQRADVWNTCGMMYAKLGRPDLEATAYRLAVSLNPQSPEALNNMGASFCTAHDGENAAAFFTAALSLRPDLDNTRAGLVGALVQSGQFQRAIAEADRVVRQDNQNVAAHWNLALALLGSGDFARGLIEHEWRRKLQNFDMRPPLETPEWNGAQPLHGKRLMVLAEQGFGDMLMWSRYLQDLAALGADVILEAHEPLMPLFQWMPCLTGIHRYGQLPLPAHDYHVYIGSLGRIVGLTVPNIVGKPYLTVPERQILGLDKFPKIGLAWKGRETHPNDRNRSLAPAAVQALVSYDKAHWVSLQFDVAPPVSSVVDCRNIIGENVGVTASIIKGLDLVISVDSAVAHLAGALGVPCWVMTPNPPEWRWCVHKSQSESVSGKTPWYDTVELIPQPRAGDWGSVIKEIHRRLDTIVQQVS